MAVLKCSSRRVTLEPLISLSLGADAELLLMRSTFVATVEVVV